MINVSHWGAPQLMLVMFLFIWAGVDAKAMFLRAVEVHRVTARYEAAVRAITTFAALIVPVVVLCLTCWGGFFA